MSSGDESEEASSSDNAVKPVNKKPQPSANNTASQSKRKSNLDLLLDLDYGKCSSQN